MKDGAATLVAPMLRLKREHVVPERTLILALTAGEEGGRRIQSRPTRDNAIYRLARDLDRVSTHDFPVHHGVEFIYRLVRELAGPR